MAEKKELGDLVEKYKKEYDKEVKALQGKTHDYNQKKHVPIKPKQVSCNSCLRVKHETCETWW